MAGVRFVFQLMVFMFIINIVIGLVGLMFPDMYGTNEFKQGLVYDQTKVTYVESQANDTLTPSTQVTAGSGFFSSILDAITAGYFSKIKLFITNYFYALPTIIDAYFGVFMDPLLSGFIKYTLTVLLTLMYIFAMIWMFTGRNFFKEGL